MAHSDFRRTAELKSSGIARNWPSQNREFKRFADYSARFGEKIKNDLASYALTGEVATKLSPPNVPKWQLADLTSGLAMRALELNQRGQIETVQTGRASPLLGLSFAYASVATIIQLELHEAFPQRFPGRTLQTLSIKSAACWLAAGYAAGCQSAERLGRLALAAANREYYFDTAYYPIFHFILSLFAASQGIRIRELSGAATREPSLTALLEKWRTRDVDVLAPLVLAACDYHTHRWKARTKDWNEFGSGVGSNFTRMPIEILMLYRLRERERLPNPDVDHPLMNSPLGKLCEPMSCKPDDLLIRVLDRARSQGFDEEAIVRGMLGQELGQ